MSTDPAERMARVRDEMARQGAKLPKVDGNGTPLAEQDYAEPQVGQLSRADVDRLYLTGNDAAIVAARQAGRLDDLLWTGDGPSFAPGLVELQLPDTDWGGDDAA